MSVLTFDVKLVDDLIKKYPVVNKQWKYKHYDDVSLYGIIDELYNMYCKQNGHYITPKDLAVIFCEKNYDNVTRFFTRRFGFSDLINNPSIADMDPWNRSFVVYKNEVRNRDVFYNSRQWSLYNNGVVIDGNTVNNNGVMCVNVTTVAGVPMYCLDINIDYIR